MPLQTVLCPDCAYTLTADLPLGQRATLQHRNTGPDVIKIAPRVRPIERPTQPMPSVGPTGNNFDTRTEGMA